jgi:hypothetical protein
MSGFDILSLVGEPWIEAASLYRGIGVTVTDTASLPSSKFLEFVLNGASIYRVLKTGETIISNAAGTSLGGIKLSGSQGEMALTSQVDQNTGSPAEVMRYYWDQPAHVGSDPASEAVLLGFGGANFSIQSAAKITHVAGNSTYAWGGVVGNRLSWTGTGPAASTGRTIDFTNFGQVTRASPIVSVSAANVADDLIQFGLTNGTNYTVAAKVDAAGRGQFQMLDLPEQGAPGNPAAATARIYAKSVDGSTKVAFRDSAGGETVLGSIISVSGGTVTTSTPVADFTQTWNDATVPFSAITANVTDTNSRIDSRLIDLKVDSGTVFQVRKNGEMIISNKSGSTLGGMVARGLQGEIGLTSQIDPNTGLPSDVFRYYWDGAVGGAAVLLGMGSNRLSIESQSAIVHIAANSRYEFEGRVSARILFVGYETATALGKTFDFNNFGQAPTRASPVVSISVQDPLDDPLHIGTFDGVNWTTKARFDGTGALFTPGATIANNQNGTTSFSVTNSDPGANSLTGLYLFSDYGADGAAGVFASSRAYNFVPGFNSCMWFDSGFELINGLKFVAANGPMKFYAGGRTPANNIFSLTETGIMQFGGETAAFPALKRSGTRLQVRTADDSGYFAIQGKLTTEANAVVETIDPTMTLTLYDATGTAYKVACVPA